MSIATDLTRLQTAKADLKTAIEGKGVTVPSATLIDGYADLVDAIQTGGGGGGTDLADYLNGDISSSYYSENVTKINGQYSFNNTGIQSLELPNCTSIAQNGLRGLSSLTSLKIHKVSSLGMDALNGCSNVPVLVFEQFVTMTTRSTQAMTGVHTVDLTSNVPSGGSSLGTMTSLETIILRGDSVRTLNSTGNLPSGVWGSGGTGGTIYVPSALIDSYKAATNWSTLDGYGTITWAAIEGSQYENYYADGTPVT